MPDQEAHTAAWKLILVWIGTAVSSITLSKVLMFITLLYTSAQLFFLLRDKWWRERGRK
jgi:hypothetical protein